MAVIIEVLNKQHKVMERHKFAQTEVRLGRAYDNDVILYDRHVCPHHATLWQNEQGQWQLQDLASLNGSFFTAGTAIATSNDSPFWSTVLVGRASAADL